MSNLPKAGAEIVLETGKFNSDFNSIIAKTGQMDEAFDSLVASAREIGGALSGIGDVDVSVNVDIPDVDFSTLEENIPDLTVPVEADTDPAITSIEAVDDNPPDVTIPTEADTEPAITEIGAIDETVENVVVPTEADTETAIADIATIDDVVPSVTVPTEAEVDTAIADIATIDDEIPNVIVPTEAEVDTAIADIATIEDILPDVVIPTQADTETAISEIQAVGENISDVVIPFNPVMDDADGVLTTLDEWNGKEVKPSVNAKETEQSKQVTDKLNMLIGLQAVEIVMNVTGTVLDVIKKLDRFTLEPILSLEDAVARVTAQTGGLNTNAETLISTMHFADLGDWQTIADVLIAAQQQVDPLKGSLEDAATAALTVTKAFPDKNPVDVLQTMNNIVNSGLVPSFKDAADLIVGGFQMGNDKGGDFLQTLEKYSNVFSELGLTGEQTLALINSGLDSGFENATSVAQSFKEINENLGKAGTDWNAPANQALRQLGLTNPKAVGEEVGANFIDSIIEAIKTNPGKGMSQQELAEAIFGAKATGTATLTGILGLDVNRETAELTGRAQVAADIVENTLRGAVDDFLLMLEEKGVEFLSSEQIDLPGKLAAIKQGLQDAVGVLTEGGSLGQALELGLKIEGTDEFISRFESAIGNFVISILEVVASLQELLPGGQTGEGTRTEIARLGEGQLTYDLKIANPDEIAGILRIATERGVDAEAIGKAASTAVQELLKEGNVGAAQDLINQIRIQGSGLKLAPEFNPSFGRGVALQKALNTWIAEGNIEMINKAIADGIVVEPESMFDVATLQGQVSIATSTMREQFNKELAAGNFVEAGKLAEGLGLTPENLTEMFNDALAGGDIPLASNLANLINSDDLKAQLEVAAEALGETFDPGVYSIDKIAEATGVTLQDVAADTAAMGEAFDTLDNDIHNAVVGNSIVPDILLIRDTALLNFPLIAGAEMTLALASKNHLGTVSSWANVAADSLMKFGDVLPILDALIAKLGQASAAASNATGAVNGVQQPTAMAEGGAFSAGEPLLFEGLGPEMVTFNRPGRVIGVNDTRALLGGGNTTNVNNNVSNNFYVQNLAQADAAGYSVARSIRGMN